MLNNQRVIYHVARKSAVIFGPLDTGRVYEFVTFFEGDSILHRRLVYARGHSSTEKTWAPRKGFWSSPCGSGSIYVNFMVPWSIKMAGKWMFIPSKDTSFTSYQPVISHPVLLASKVHISHIFHQFFSCLWVLKPIPIRVSSELSTPRGTIEMDWHRQLDEASFRLRRGWKCKDAKMLFEVERCWDEFQWLIDLLTSKLPNFSWFFQYIFQYSFFWQRFSFEFPQMINNGRTSNRRLMRPWAGSPSRWNTSRWSFRMLVEPQ